MEIENIRNWQDLAHPFANAAQKLVPLAEKFSRRPLEVLSELGQEAQTASDGMLLYWLHRGGEFDEEASGVVSRDQKLAAVLWLRFAFASYVATNTQNELREPGIRWGDEAVRKTLLSAWHELGPQWCAECVPQPWPASFRVGRDYELN